MWDIYAKNYDTAVLSFSAYKELMQKVIENLDLRSDDYVLDLGCGTGNLENFIKHSDLDFKFECVDISENMLKVARKKLKGDTRFNFSQRDLNEDLNYGKVFSKAIMVHSLYTLKDLDSILQNISSVLKEGGELHIVNPLEGADINKMMKYELAKSGFILFFLKLLITIPANIINRVIARKASSKDFHFLSSEEYIVLLGKNGFAIKETFLVYANQSTYLISKLKNESLSL